MGRRLHSNKHQRIKGSFGMKLRRGRVVLHPRTQEEELVTKKQRCWENSAKPLYESHTVSGAQEVRGIIPPT